MNAEEEGRTIASVEHALARAYPDVPREKIKNAVEQSWMKYRYAAVRDFVPLLVQREATVVAIRSHSERGT